MAESRYRQQYLNDDVADVGEIDRAGAGDLGHHAFEQLGGGIAQDLGADDGSDRGGDGEEQTSRIRTRY